MTDTNDTHAEILPFGDCAFLIRYAVEGYSRSICERVQALQRIFQTNNQWLDVISAYDSLLLRFNPLQIDPLQAEDDIHSVMKSFKPDNAPDGRLVEIPVYYGGENGPDMDVIMAHSGLSEADIIERHSAIEYLVCMMGFIPGFTFLSETDPALHHPRRETPRQRVPAGSVGIAGWQTGIYGLDSPGGWQIIGRTHLTLFDRQRPDPFLINAGDRVRFVPFEIGR